MWHGEHLQKIMASAPASSVHELKRHGFCVVRGFCSAEEAQQMEQMYKKQILEQDKNYALKRSVFPAEILKRLHALLPPLSEATACQYTDIDPTFAYATRQADANINLGWHCDSGSFYDFGTHDTFLNCYVIVQKSDRAHSNISFVSWERLAQLDPSLPPRLKNGGSVNFNVCNGRFLMDDTFHDLAQILPVHFDELATTPHLDVGDLLLFGVDVPHRTQDNATARIAFTAKAHNKAQRLRFQASLPYLAHCLRPSYEMLRMSYNKYGLLLYARKHLARVRHGVTANLLAALPSPLRPALAPAIAALLIALQLTLAAPLLCRRFAVVGAVKGWDSVMAWRMASASAVSLASAAVLAVVVAALARAIV